MTSIIITTEIMTIDRFADPDHTIEIDVNVRVAFPDGTTDTQATVRFIEAYEAQGKLQRWDVPHVEIGAFDLQYGEMTRAQMVEVYSAVLNCACDRFEGYAQTIG